MRSTVRLTGFAKRTVARLQREIGEACAMFHDKMVRSVKCKSRIQLTSDGHRAYLDAVESAFGSEIDFAQLIKLYGNEAPTSPEVRYSPAICTGTRRTVINGAPDPEHISTSICERQNLTLRMSSRRFTRLTNAFSKKVENHAHAVALHFVWYNFVRVHQTLRVTPAMEAGLSNHVWSVEDIAALLSNPKLTTAK